MENKLLVFDPNSNPTEKYYEKLSNKNKKIVDNFEKYCLVNAGKGRNKKAKSNAIRFLIMANKRLDSINLEDLQAFLRILKESGFGDYSKNDIKAYLKRFLKWYFKDWSKRFNDFEDMNFVSDPQRKEKIKEEDILSKEDVEKLIKAEPSIFWKTYLIVQYQGALRTIEARTLKWEQVNMEDPDVCWLTIISKKNRRAQEKERLAPPLNQQAIYFLNELKKWQSENNKKSPYVFPSKDVNIPISSPVVNMWFSRHTKRILGKARVNYILRHSEGEELHKLIREGKLTKENALLMMGHSEKMFDKIYSHSNKKELMKLLKKQVLNVDYIAPEKKHELEKQIEKLERRIKELEKENKERRWQDPKINEIFKFIRKQKKESYSHVS